MLIDTKWSLLQESVLHARAFTSVRSKMKQIYRYAFECHQLL